VAVFVLKPLLAGSNAPRKSGAVFKPSLIIGALIVVFGIAIFVWLMSRSEPSGAADGDATARASTAMPEAGSRRPAGSMDQLLLRLEKRLAGQGGTDTDWELLAQTYEFMGRNADAQRARSHHLPTSPDIDELATPGSEQPPPPGNNASGDSSPVDGAVELADALKSKVPAGLTLFIIAKAVDSPGPPVAIVRTMTGHWPLRFTLDDASAMVPDRKLSTARRVTVEARVSRSGMAAPQPGDFQSGVTTLNPHDRRSVRLLIDHVIG
jgi:hypothetical protein